MSIHAYNIIDWAWAVVLIVWIAGSFSNKRAIRRQPSHSRAVQVLLAILGGLLISQQGLFKVQGGRTIVPQTSTTAAIAVALTLAGVAFALWSRFAIGKNWSATVTVKESHHLVRTGPYAIVRHPIYCGFLFALLGTAVARGTAGAFVGVGILLFVFWLKLRLEEQFMLEQFGPAYEDYRNEVKRLIPFVW
jgi:protein-S-isoprenylcysteine O-methyltransferase Ste14